tara:strand:- start:432 stop:599 length:168 start_codon:yes stop_codon:yes gene_type:complete
MFWDLVIGVVVFFLCVIYYAAAKKVDALQKDVDDLMSVVRVLRYHAMQDNKGGDD